MSNKSVFPAYTLIELLVVIAILSVLAVIVLVVINPSERLASANDSGRIAVITQLGKSLESFVISSNTYPSEANWGSQLIATGYPQVFPSGVKYISNYGTTACTTNVLPATDPNYCYALDNINNYGALIFVKLEARSVSDKCAVGLPYFVYSTADHRAGTICSSSDPSPWAPGTMNYQD